MESSHSEEISSNPSTPIRIQNHSPSRANKDLPSGSETLPKRKPKSAWLPSSVTQSRRAEEFNSEHAEQSSLSSPDLYVKPVFLKGLFSVATTSTKKPSVIRADILRVLDDLGYTWRESSGYFECIQGGRFSAGSNPSRAENSEHTNSFASTKSIDQEGATTQHPEIHKGTSNTNSLQSSASTTTSEHHNEDISGHGEENPVKFQISIVKMRWLLGLHGLQFRRLSGHPWEYKNVCQQILHKLKL
ncbi:Serine/threonine-protein kinase [Basidiobolus ranarum]|uniref:non-specific serine/threonine protein kinase n=1 Tax=Basidiobolus ranarum TaxID=34480 RepID=A0ABR2VYY5_9FUNG